MSAKGLEWALRLRGDLVIRTEQLREALADIEPLRQELARLEEQLKGVERLVAVYHEQLGYPKAAEVAQPPVPQPALREPALQLDAAFISAEPPAPSGLSDHVRGRVLGAVEVIRNVVMLMRKTAVRLWLSLRMWVVERLPHSRTLS
jgi:hypothetical protein